VSVFCICCWPLPPQSFSDPSPWDSWPYFTVSDLRLLFSSPPVTHRVTVEEFDATSTGVKSKSKSRSVPRLHMEDTYNPSAWTSRKHSSSIDACVYVPGIIQQRPLPTDPPLSNATIRHITLLYFPLNVNFDFSWLLLLVLYEPSHICILFVNFLLLFYLLVLTV
jgi:hypothetical protein